MTYSENLAYIRSLALQNSDIRLLEALNVHEDYLQRLGVEKAREARTYKVLDERGYALTIAYPMRRNHMNV